MWEMGRYKMMYKEWKIEIDNEREKRSYWIKTTEREKEENWLRNMGVNKDIEKDILLENVNKTYRCEQGVESM